MANTKSRKVNGGRMHGATIIHVGPNVRLYAHPRQVAKDIIDLNPHAIHHFGFGTIRCAKSKDLERNLTKAKQAREDESIAYELEHNEPLNYA